MQFTQLAEADAKKTEWSRRRLERAERKAAWHLAECVPCLLRSLRSSLPSSPN